MEWRQTLEQIIDGIFVVSLVKYKLDSSTIRIKTEEREDKYISFDHGDSISLPGELKHE